MRRALTWVLLLPFAAASVLIGHVVAYRVTGAPADGLHGYLAHAPQIVLILATLALLGLAADARARRSSPLPLVLLAIFAFVAQEHLERLIRDMLTFARGEATGGESIPVSALLAEAAQVFEPLARRRRRDDLA